MAIALESMNLRPELVAACRKQGFREATPIQALVIPVVMQGRDVVVEAKTGSGKTLAYGLPLLHAEPRQAQFPEVLVVTPTRELAAQVHAELTRTAGTLERRVVALTGGGGMDRQEAWLEAGATIAVGTMGRLEELLARGLLRLDHVRTLVLDEVDELLHGGFSGNLAALLKQLPGRRQTLLFSATIPRDVEEVARQFMREPERLQLTAARELPAELSHRVLRTTVGRRVADFGELLRVERPYQVLLFCGTRHEAEEVQDALAGLGLEAQFLHGELSAIKRRKLIELFRGGELPILVATDLAARGLDLPGVDLVVNYSLPEGPSAYLHRAGRTGRAGRPGVVVTLLIEQQQGRFEKLKQTLTFQSVEVRGGRLVIRPLKSREERDLEFRQLPRRAPPAASAPQRSPPPARGSARPERASGGGRRGAPRRVPRPGARRRTRQ
jgi:ATP-dependent RNA helicase DeaD